MSILILYILCFICYIYQIYLLLAAIKRIPLAGFSACGGSRKRHLPSRRSAIHRRFLYDRKGTFLSYKNTA